MNNKTKYDALKIREDFPVLFQEVNGKPLVYLDNAATTQKPVSVIRKISEYYEKYNSNIHRGVHSLSQKATTEYENSREIVRKFINAKSTKEIIFLRGTTEGINLVANSFGKSNIKAGDEILISHMEHHSNIVPWQLLCELTGAVLKVIPILDNGELDFEAYKNLLSDRTKIVGIVHQSNTLGTENPVKSMAKLAHDAGAIIVVDGAQSIQHFAVDVQDLDCDFYAFSGHKLYGPTGIGVLFGKESLLSAMPPFQGGGDMIASVTFEKTIYNSLPYKFEAGTPNIEGVIALGAAIEYIESIGLDNIYSYEKELYSYTVEKMSEYPEIVLIGSAPKKGGVFSFVIDNIHPHDIGTIFDTEGVAIRTGHLCTQPVMKRFNIPAVSRVSLGIYNTKEDIDRAAATVKKVLEVFA